MTCPRCQRPRIFIFTYRDNYTALERPEASPYHTNVVMLTLRGLRFGAAGSGDKSPFCTENVTVLILCGMTGLAGNHPSGLANVVVWIWQPHFGLPPSNRLESET